MKISIALSALLIGGFMAATTEPANAVVYCQYVEYPAGCTVRAGVVLRPRPVARAGRRPASAVLAHRRTAAARSIAPAGADRAVPAA